MDDGSSISLLMLDSDDKDLSEDDSSSMSRDSGASGDFDDLDSVLGKRASERPPPRERKSNSVVEVNGMKIDIEKISD